MLLGAGVAEHGDESPAALSPAGWAAAVELNRGRGPGAAGGLLCRSTAWRS